MQQEDFFGAAVPLPADAIIKAAANLDVEPEALEAVHKKESRGKGFLPDGRPIILYEPHIFGRLTKHKFTAKHPDISTRSQKQNKYGPSGAFQYQKLAKAMELDETAALKSCSWGLYQIMGFNHGDAGYGSPQDMVMAFTQGEQQHLDAFCAIIVAWNLGPALRNHDWATFARKYNGPNYMVNHYDSDLARFYTELSEDTVRKGSQGEKVKRLQALLNLHLKPAVKVDGFAGESTIAALKKFQELHHLTVDGVAGPQTFAELASARVETEPVINSKRVAGAAAGTVVGGGGATFGVMDWLTRGQQAASKVQEAAIAVTSSSKQQAVIKTVDIVADLARQNAFLLSIIIFLSLALLALSAYVVWTKIQDNKRAKGLIV